MTKKGVEARPESMLKLFRPFTSKLNIRRFGSMKYNMGEKFKVIVEISKIDEGDPFPYYISLVGAKGNIGCWVSEEDLYGVIAEADPEVKKAAIKQKIGDLQKQLHELELK